MKKQSKSVCVRFVLNTCILNYFTFPLSSVALFLIRLDPIRGILITQISTKILIKESGLKEFSHDFFCWFGQVYNYLQTVENLKIKIYQDRKWLKRQLYVRRPRAVLKTSGTVFADTDQPRPQNGDFESKFYVKPVQLKSGVAVLFAEFVGLILHVPLCRKILQGWILGRSVRYVTKTDVNGKETRGLK